MKKILLSIAIPTYNRGSYLDLCLNSIVSQLDASISDEIEVIVYNNASTDNTKLIVEKYKNKFHIDYNENQENLGPDLNIAKCFDKANGKYVWIFGDDDFILDGKLKNIVGLLKNGDWGTIKLESISYTNDINEIPKDESKQELKYKSYVDPIKFVEVVNYWATFISGIIVNKEVLLPKRINYYEFKNTNLIQLNWVVNAMFQGKTNNVVETPCIACKADNTGGYKLVTVFSKNYNFILKKLTARGCDKRIIDITNESLISSFFPFHLNKLFKSANKFDGESGFLILINTFWKYKSFWMRIFPLYVKRLLR